MTADNGTLGHELRTANQLELAGRLEEAAEIYRRLMSEHADNWQVLRPYARLSWNRQQHDQALALLDNASALAPDVPDLLIDRADYCFALDRFGEAEKCIRHAIALAPDNRECLVKLALILLERQDKEGARDACQTALAGDPDMKSAHQLLGDLDWQDGNFESAVEHLSRSRKTPNPQSDINAALASSLFALGRTPEIAELSEPSTPGQKYMETMIRAVFNWQRGDFDRSEFLIRKSAPLLARCADAPRVAHFHRIELLLEKLLEYLSENTQLYEVHAEAPLFVIGDNQALAAAHLATPFRGRLCRIRSILVVSLRVMDILSPESNSQDRAIHNILDRLPVGADVVLSAGSADLHFKEGILNELQANPGLEIETYLEQFVTRYLDRTLDWCKAHDLNPAYMIPPPSNAPVRKIPSSDRESFKALPKVYAEIMRRCLAERNLVAIDLYTATVTGEGNLKRDRFIDQHHVMPSTILEAFEMAAN